MFEFRVQSRLVSALAVMLAAGGSVALAAQSNSQSTEFTRGWPQWRGPLGTGESPTAKPPTTWSETQNVRWKVAVPGQGLSTPIVWGDRVYIQTAIPTGRHEKTGEAPKAEEADASRDRSGRGGRGGRGMGNTEKTTEIHQFAVLGFDRKSGKEVFRKVLVEAVPHEAIHQDSTNASGSPTTNGKHIYAYFGSRGIYCMTMDGNVVWSKDLGDMSTRRGFGEGSSPTLYEDTLIITWDHEGPSFIVALDATNGKEKWRVERDEATTWATPLVVPAGDKVQVIANGTTRVRAYDIKDGKLIWECGGQTTNAIPTPVFERNMLYVMTGFRGSALHAINLTRAKGDISGSPAIEWQQDRNTPYVPSPLLYKSRLYFLKENTGILSCIESKDGAEVYRERLAGISGVYASPVAANNHVYVQGRDGNVVVIEPASELKIVATNKLDDWFDSSPAMVDSEIYLRGAKHLYCIAEGGKQ